ncbi:MAG: hypothetical protein ACYDCC_13065 [Actinomycetota bacterium]
MRKLLCIACCFAAFSFGSAHADTTSTQPYYGGTDSLVYGCGSSGSIGSISISASPDGNCFDIPAGSTHMSISAIDSVFGSGIGGGFIFLGPSGPVTDGGQGSFCGSGSADVPQGATVMMVSMGSLNNCSSGMVATTGTITVTLS